MTIKPTDNSDELEISVVFRIPKANIDQGRSFLDAEEALAQRLSEIGLKGTERLLTELDSDGKALQSGQKTWWSKGQMPRVIESAHGAIHIMCHVYQTSAGGVTRVPVEERARLVGSATPKFAKMISSKLAQMPCGAVAADMRDNHSRPMSKSFAQDLGSALSALATVRMADEDWQPLSKAEEVHTIAVGVDGAHLNTKRDKWRQSMAGTIALYDKKGERLETLYVGAGPGETPPEGKAAFFTRMDHCLAAVRQAFPQADVLGLSDGAADLQQYLERRTDSQLLDFHHAAEYISLIAPAFCPRCKAGSPQLEAWASKQRHALRDQPAAAWALLEKIRKRLQPKKRSPRRSSNAQSAKPGKPQLPALTQAMREALHTAQTYFTNNISKMDYAGWKALNRPIGSGVTEAACKTLIKQRLCQSGMRWSIAASDALICLRALYLTPSRWNQFWTLHRSTPASAL